MNRTPVAEPGTARKPDARPLLEARGVKKYFPVTKGGVFGRAPGFVKAVDGVDFALGAGETFGLAGESGCGKTTLANLILRLERPTAGEIYWEGADINRVDRGQTRRYREAVQAVFQDPWSSLDSRMRVGRIIAEPLVINEHPPAPEVRARVAELLQQVGLDPSYSDRFPHEFSGGQRQRIAIARALVVTPRLIVLDEPVSALDVSIRAQILNLLKDIQKEYRLSYFLISHNLATMRYISDTIGIMYLGRVVEIAESEAFFEKPLHPYSKALLSATLSADPDAGGQRLVLQGEVPSPINPPSGCRFRTRCPFVMEVCAEVDPALEEKEAGHRVACHLY